jgi:maleylacetate reductase
VHKGRVVFGAMDEVVFGRHAAEAIVEQLDRLGAQRAFLMVSGTLHRETGETAAHPLSRRTSSKPRST